MAAAVAVADPVRAEAIARSIEDASDKAEIYHRIGLTLTYHPAEKRVAAEARPNSIMYVGACPRSVIAN